MLTLMRSATDATIWFVRLEAIGMRLGEKLTLGIVPCFVPGFRLCIVASLTQETGYFESDIFNHFERAQISEVTIIHFLDDRIHRRFRT
jgi:hypothetical protein